MKNYLAPIMIVTISLITACGKDGGGSGGKSGSTPRIQEQQAQGGYRAILRPINNSLSGFLPTGVAEIKIDGEEVRVRTLLEDDARVPHMQSIHAGTRCPTEADDRNKDGLVDIKEIESASGKVFIPLDGDLSTAEVGAGIYPSGSGFTYNETTELALLEQDTKERTGQNLNLGGRVVMIHGVATGTKMPTTVAVKEGMSQQASIPIACGVIQRVE